MTRSEIKTSLEAVYPQELTDALLTRSEERRVGKECFA